MIEWLRHEFPRPFHYLVALRDTEEINRFLESRLVQPFQQGRKQKLWGREAQDLPIIGRRTGWVPNASVGAFLNETVEMEIADAFAASENYAASASRFLPEARSLLQRFDLSSLSQQNPYFLSEGESKLLWLLTQWAKQPEFLIIGYLPANLSQHRLAQVVDFLFETRAGSTMTPTCVLGFVPDSAEWCLSLNGSRDWKIVDAWPLAPGDGAGLRSG